MMNLIYLIASAIATEEGFWTLNSLPSRNHNPGDLRGAPWLPAPVSMNKGFVLFKSDPEGVAGLYHQIALNIARGFTLRKLIEVWAPPSENNTSDYLENVQRKVGVNPDVPLMNYLEIDRIP